MNAVNKQSPAERSMADLDAEGMTAITDWWAALVDGRSQAVEKVLAPEFQIMREDGSSDDKRDYIANGMPHVIAVPEITRLVVTAHGDQMVTRYVAKVHETRDGERVERSAPRLTVFRKDGGAWRVVAHGNFATLQK
jgi:hypothetical protein